MSKKINLICFNNIELLAVNLSILNIFLYYYLVGKYQKVSRKTKI